MLDHTSLGVSDIDRVVSMMRPCVPSHRRHCRFRDGRGSDYEAAPSPLEFTITLEAEVRTPIAGAHLCFRAPKSGGGRRISRGGPCGGRPRPWLARAAAALSRCLLRRLRLRSRRTSPRGRLPCAGDPNHTGPWVAMQCEIQTATDKTRDAAVSARPSRVTRAVEMTTLRFIGPNISRCGRPRCRQPPSQPRPVAGHDTNVFITHARIGSGSAAFASLPARESCAPPVC